MQTSHSPHEPSAADLSHALRSVGFPMDRAGLVDHARNWGEQRAAELIAQLPAQTFHDAAEVTRALEFGKVQRS